MQPNPTHNPSESEKPLSDSSMDLLKGVMPSPGKTIADLAVSLASTENARFQRKLMRNDAELEKHRARMNKVADAQADDFVNRAYGEKAPDGNLQSPLGAEANSMMESSSSAMEIEDDMLVFTNSPITVTNHPAPVVVKPDPPAWMRLMTWVSGLLALVVLVLLLLLFFPGEKDGDDPTPSPAPVEGGGAMHIEVIPGENRMN